MQVRLVPATDEKLDLVIESTPAYQKFRPSAVAVADGAGADVGITATLKSSTGSAPLTRVESFEWLLLGTSKEPGIALNHPINARDERYDLELNGEGEFFVLTNEKQRMERAAQKGQFSDTVRIVPFDWGGWSELKVIAHLEDGRQIIGKLAGSSEENVRIPRRAADSHIADRWKESRGASGADDTDDDNVPLGDGTRGDGLTLYEEYRGFYEGLNHREGDYKVKDFFVQTNQNEAFRAAVEHMGALSKLKTHGELQTEDLPANRVINGNHRSGAHATDQHAVTIVTGTDLKVSSARGGPGNPKKISSIQLVANWRGLTDDVAQTTIIHELFHSVNVWHHGDHQFEAEWWPTADLGLSEHRGGGTRAIRVFSEVTGTELTDSISAGLSGVGDGKEERKVGEQQGQASGVESCVMRYDTFDAAVWRNDSGRR